MGYIKSIPSGDKLYIGATLASPQLTPIYECHEHGLWRLDLDGVFRQHLPPSRQWR